MEYKVNDDVLHATDAYAKALWEYQERLQHYAQEVQAFAESDRLYHAALRERANKTIWNDDDIARYDAAVEKYKAAVERFDAAEEEMNGHDKERREATAAYLAATANFQKFAVTQEQVDAVSV